MVVFEDGAVVVQDGFGVVGVDKEFVVQAGVIEVCARVLSKICNEMVVEENVWTYRVLMQQYMLRKVLDR